MSPPSRFEGLKQALAENPDVELLEDQTAEWDRTKAVSVTEAFLAKIPRSHRYLGRERQYGTGSTGSPAHRRPGRKRSRWSASTAPAKPLMQPSQASSPPQLTTTRCGRAVWGCRPYSAKTGVFDPAKEPKEHREFYFEPVYVNTENAQEVKTNYIDGIPNYDWNGSLGPRAG